MERDDPWFDDEETVEVISQVRLTILLLFSSGYAVLGYTFRYHRGCLFSSTSCEGYGTNPK
jgi:hypothetical protein